MAQSTIEVLGDRVIISVGRQKYKRRYASHASALAASGRARYWAYRLKGKALRARAEKWSKAG